MSALLGSLCSGMGGLDIAVNQAFGTRTAWHAEVDADAVRVLSSNAPDVPNLGDINFVDWSRVECVDVIAAGFPCQPVSSAGRQRVSHDARWLWPAVFDAIATVGPDHVVIENVENLTRVNCGLVFDELLHDLRRAGYGASWCVIGACMVGACHHRHRTFVVARYVGRRAPAARNAPVQKCVGVRRASMAPTVTANVRRAQGTSVDVAAKRWRSGRRNIDDWAALLPTVTARDASSGAGHAPSSTGGPNLRTVAATLTDQFGEYADAVANWESVVGRVAGAPTELSPRGARRLTATFAEWMLGLPAGWMTDHVGRSAAIRLAGNGVVPQQASAAIEVCLSALDIDSGLAGDRRAA